MNLGDNLEYQRENNSEEIVHKPEEINSESEGQNEGYEYVDEDGNPIDPKEMEDYEVVDEDDEEEFEDEPEEEGEEEYVDEDGNPIDPKEMEDYEIVDEEDDEEYEDEEELNNPEYQDTHSLKEETLSAQESEEILEDIKDISGIPMEQLKEEVPPVIQETIQENNFNNDPVQETIEEAQQPELIQETQLQEPIEENIVQAEPVQEIAQRNYSEEVVEEFTSPVVEEPIQETPQQTTEIYQPQEELIQETIQPDPVQETQPQEIIQEIQEPVEEIQQPEPVVEEPIQEQATQEDLDFKRKQEELIRTISTGKKPEESDLDIFIQQAQNSQEEIAQKKEEPIQETPQQTTEIYQPQEELIQETIQPDPVQETQPQEIIQEIQEPVEEIQQPEPVVEEPIQEEKQETNEDLLQKLSMSNKSSPEVAPEKTNSEDSIEDPYIYRKGHPHLGTNFSMDTISNLANKIFNTDEAVDKLNKTKKK